MNSDKNVFEDIVKKHQILKCQGVSSTLNEQIIKGLIEEYSTLNSTKIDVEEVLSISQE